MNPEPPLLRSDPPAPDLGPHETPIWEIIPEIAPPASEALTESERNLLHQSLDELARREKEALRLFAPLEAQEKFFASHAGERLVLGGNRGGKSTAALVELARAVTGQDPHGKYPLKDGRVIIVGRDLKHLSKVFYEKLFRPGAFRVIRDLHTGQWRTYNPANPDDDGREEEVRLAPPLIPKRFYDEKAIVWETKKDNTASTIHFRNGWSIHFFSALGVIPQGWDVDLVIFDEEIVVEGWYREMSARLLDRRKKNRKTGLVTSGKFIWSATPQAGTQQLYALQVRADEERESEVALFERGEPVPPPTIESFTFGLLENNFVSIESINEFIAKLEGDPEEYEVRVLGKFALLGSRVYSEFMPKGAHGCPPVEIGSDWTRYVMIDPGYQVCACLFVAVPPPDHPMHGRKVIYDELYIKKSTAKLFAKLLKQKLGENVARKFIIDHRAGGQHDFTSGRTNEENYSEALKEANVFCEATGHGFTYGADDTKAGIEAVRDGLHIMDGKAEWVVVRDKCKWFLWEADKYAYKKTPDGKPTDEPLKLNDHLMDCWRYAAMANLCWVKPTTRKRKLGYTSEALRQKKERAKARRSASGESGVKVY